MREAQYMLNLLGWINSTKKRDPFFIETQEFLEYAVVSKFGFAKEVILQTDLAI